LGLDARLDVPQVAPVEPLARAPGVAVTRAERDRWVDTRETRIARLTRAPRIAATTIAHATEFTLDDKPEPPAESPPWQRGRAGTSVGRAVHAVLQTIDLKTGTGGEDAARAQAYAEGIPSRGPEILELVENARKAKTVRAAVASGRYWREVYVAAECDGVTVEGFIDLLYESAEGLVIVDYKTDAVPDETTMAAATERYRLQGAAYAVAVEQALGRPVARCVFVFARPKGERDVADLPAAMREVRTRLPELAGTPN
jgi:ATP-dependent helicase/nuclease subunit A